MAKNDPKFDLSETVMVNNEEGTIEEISETKDRKGFQYRVRIDFSDRWVPECDIQIPGYAKKKTATTSKKKAAPVAPKTPAPAAPTPK